MTDEFLARRLHSLAGYNKLAEKVQEGATPWFFNSGMLDSKYNDFAISDFDLPFKKHCIPYMHLFEYVDPTDKDILEVGCGFGRGCFFLKNHYNIRTITGCDINVNVLNVARKYFPEITFLEGNAVSLQELNKQFDIIITVETLLYWDCHSDSFMSMASALRSGGSLLISSYTRRGDTSLDIKFQQHGLKLVDQHDINDKVIQALSEPTDSPKINSSNKVRIDKLKTNLTYVSKHYKKQ